MKRTTTLEILQGGLQWHVRKQEFRFCLHMVLNIGLRFLGERAWNSAIFIVLQFTYHMW